MRQEQGEHAALVRAADEPDFAMEQPGELAADRQPQARAAVFAAGAAVGLLECLEDDLLLVLGYPDTRVHHREREHFAGAVEVLVVLAPAGGHRMDIGPDLALMRELER